MAEQVGSAFISVRPDLRGMQRETGRRLPSILEPAGKEAGQRSGKAAGAAMGTSMQKSARGAGRRVGGVMSKGIGNGLRGVATGFAAMFAVQKVTGFFKETISAGQEGIQVSQRLGNVFQQMGGEASQAFQDASKQAKVLSKEIGKDQTSIEKVQTKLATFGKIWEDPVKGAQNFDRATRLAFDAAAAGFGTADSNASQFGRALQDPTKGMSALTRTGISFSEQEQKKIKQLQASGDLLGAQEKVYSALEKQVGGTASEGVTSAEKLRTAWANFQDELGRKLVPIVDMFARLLTEKVIPAISGLVGWMSDNSTVVKVAAVIIGSLLVGAFTAWAVTAGIAAAATIAATWPIIAITAGILALAAGLLFAWRNTETFRTVVKAVFSAVGAAGKWLWNRALKPAFDGISGFITDILIPIVQRLWKHVIQPAFKGIGAIIKGAWNRVIKPAFNAVKNGVGAVRDAFRSGVNGIRRIWNGLMNIARKPVNFIINQVYNKGVRRLWNKVNDLWGGNDLPTLGLIGGSGGGRPAGRGFHGGLAHGGMLSANQAGMVNRPTAIVGEGSRVHPEFVIPTDPKHRGRALGLWEQAGGQLMEEGGIIGKLTSGANWALDLFTSPLKVFAGMGKRVIDAIIGRLPLPDTGFAQGVAKIPGAIVSGMSDAVKKNAGGAGYRRGLAFARSQDGKPYQWGGVGNPSFDCSGFIGSIVAAILGKNTRQRYFTTHAFTGSTGPMGFVRGLASPFQIGVTHGGVGHMAGTLLGIPVESSGSGGVQVGGGARGANSSLFTHRYGLKFGGGSKELAKLGAEGANFDSGGFLPPGLSLAVNGTGKPEPVFTPSQFDQIGNREGGPFFRDYIQQFYGNERMDTALHETMFTMRKARRGGLR